MSSDWVKFVKTIQKREGLTYAQALSAASPQWKDPKVRSKFIKSLGGEAEKEEEKPAKKSIAPKKKAAPVSKKGKEPKRNDRIKELEEEAAKYRKKYYSVKAGEWTKPVQPKRKKVVVKKTSDSDSDNSSAECSDSD